MADTSPRYESTQQWPEPGRPIRSHEGGNWVLFAGIMICLAGILNIIWGIAAIADSRFFVADATYVLSDLNTWGWVMLALGVAQVFGAYSIAVGGQAGRWFGIAVAGLNAIGALMSIPAYPVWGLALFTIDILVIYGLATYGGDPRVVE